MTTLVRTPSLFVFEINPKTMKALSVSYYDPYCYSDPRVDCVYIEFGDWINP